MPFPSSPRVRFTWTTSKPPEPSLRSRAWALTITSSPSWHGPTRVVSAWAGRTSPSTSTSIRCQGAGASALVTTPRRSLSIGLLHGGVEEGERDVEHPVERLDADALVGLVRVLGAVREVQAREAGGNQRVRIRAAARDDVAARVPAGAQGGLGDLHLRRGGPDAEAVEEPRHVDVEVALRGVRAIGQVVDELAHERLDLRLVERAHLRLDHAALRHDVDPRPAGDRADVRRRLLVEAPERHRGDRARGGDDRAAAGLRTDPGVRGDAAQLGDDAVVVRRGEHDLADRGGVVEHVAEAAAQLRRVERLRTRERMLLADREEQLDRDGRRL